MTINRNNKRSVKAGRIPVLSFFTGGGFLDIGFEQAGFEVIWTNELNTVFADMYSFAMTLWRRSVIPGCTEASISAKESIENIYAPRILKEAFNGKRPPFFGIIGGPPCPDFSSGGRNRGGDGANGRLSRTYVQRICRIKPSFFVFENVSGLHRTKIHREFLSKLERALEKKGYCLDLRILNSLEFGLPQNRERLFMIGVQQRLVKRCLGRTVETSERDWFHWPEPEYANAKESYSWPDIVPDGKRASKPSKVPTELTVYSLLNRNNDPSNLLNGKDCFKPHSDKFDTIREGDTRRKSFKRLHRFRFSPTVCYGNNEVHLHPWKRRRLSVREAMRIQGIPDTYALPEDASLTAKFAIVSNGVPVPLGHAVAKSMMTFFEGVGTQKNRR